MNASAMKLVAIAREGGLVHKKTPGEPGAHDGTLDHERIAEALQVSVERLRAWLRDLDTARAARACPTWAPRLLRYLVDDPKSCIHLPERRKSTTSVDIGFSELQPLGVGLTETRSIWGRE